MDASVSASFAAKKSKILAGLSVPEEVYADASPKGSVDAGIKYLIDVVNRLEGAVTTSSCAGRISVFLEGRKDRPDPYHSVVDESLGSRHGLGASPSAVPGGKGLGGRWLFVSHDPVKIEGSLVKNLLIPSLVVPESQDVMHGVDPTTCRLVKLAFEPMILHIMTASLQHAKPVLAAALDAGFRESGVQSLKALDDANAFPMVAIRTAGLSLSSVIGIVNSMDGDSSESVCPLVDDGYLKLLFTLANEKFNANTERVDRLGSNLSKLQQDKDGHFQEGWEERNIRAERKRAEGLSRQARLLEDAQLESGSNSATLHISEDPLEEGSLDLLGT